MFRSSVLPGLGSKAEQTRSQVARLHRLSIRRTRQTDDHLAKLESDQEAWNGLLAWLRDVHGMDTGPKSLKVKWIETKGAGRGLVALENITAAQPLLSIPTTALMNARTLAPFFPAHSLPEPNNTRNTLTAVQAVSFYLAAHRHDATCPWGPYIRGLPVEFGDHPVNVMLTQQHSRDTLVPTLRARFAALSLGPPTLKALLRLTMVRCENDLASIRAYLSTHPGLFQLNGELDLEDFLWGWLNVNTRQVWMDLNLSKHDNFTLAPIFDMCNHTSGSGGQLKASSTQHALTLRVPYDLTKGDEVCIQYGSHSNVKLLVEYGFVLDAKQCGAWEVSVGDLMLTMFEAQGVRGKAKLAALEMHGYSFRDMRLHFHPEPAAPSYGLIVALRLLHSELSRDDFSEWFQVLWSGTFAQMHTMVDRRVAQEVYDLCATIVERAERAMDALKDIGYSEGEDITALWREELSVALAVEASLRRGLVEFD